METHSHQLLTVQTHGPHPPFVYEDIIAVRLSMQMSVATSKWRPTWEHQAMTRVSRVSVVIDVLTRPPLSLIPCRWNAHLETTRRSQSSRDQHSVPPHHLVCAHHSTLTLALGRFHNMHTYHVASTCKIASQDKSHAYDW